MSISNPTKTTPEIMDCLNKIFQAEMSGIIRYLHYSFMIMGHHRIPIQKWFRDQATESQGHATTIGEKITSYGGHPPTHAAKIDETKTHKVDEILAESLAFEMKTLDLYKQLVKLSGDDIALEELARGMVLQETDHVDEVKKMMRISK